jgi:hypothetical protein
MSHILARVELQLGLILGLLLKADSPAAVSVFLTLRRSTNQREALNAAAGTALETKESAEAFHAALNVLQPAQAQRKDLAHGIWGASNELPNALLWLEPIEGAKWSTRMMMTPGEVTDQQMNELAPQLFVYRKQDLEALYRDFREASDIALLTSMWLGPLMQRHSASEEACRQLCAVASCSDRDRPHATESAM